MSQLRLGLAAGGLLGVAGQILLLRELAVTFYGNELVYGVALALWLCWTAVGAQLGSRVANRIAERGFATLLVVGGGLLILQLVALRGARLWLGLAPGALPDLDTVLGAGALSLAPLCLTGGLLFTTGSRLLARQPTAIGRAYALESAGAVLGGSSLSLVVLPRLSPFQIALSLFGLMACLAAWLALGEAMGRHAGPRARHGPTRRMASIALGGLCLLWLFLALRSGHWLEMRTLDWVWQDRLAVQETPYGRLIVLGRGAQRVFYQDGRLLFESQGTEAEEVAHLPLLAHPRPRRVVLIGGGLDGTLGRILEHPVERVEYAELDPWLIELGRRHLGPAEAAALDDPRVRLWFADGRQLLRQLDAPADLIIVHLPEPSTGQVNRFYTIEFFALAAKALAPGGVLAFRLPATESYWNRAMQERNASIRLALARVFPYVVVTPGDSNSFLAALAPLELKVETLGQRLSERQIATRWLTVQRIGYLLEERRRAALEARFRARRSTPANSDRRPVSYLYEMQLWLSRTASRPLRLPSATPPIVATLAAGASILAWRAVRRSRESRIVAAVAVSGFSLMALEVILLLAFQSGHGSLYQQIGLLVASFMAGMAIGGAAVRKPSWSLLTVLQLGLGGTGLLTLGLGFQPSSLPAAAFVLVGLITGCAGGALFACASGLAVGSVPHIAGRLYAMDLVGAACGAVAASLALVPGLGMVASCWAVALANLAIALAMVLP